MSRGADSCDRCGGLTVQPWYVMRYGNDRPDTIRYVLCNSCSNTIVKEGCYDVEG